MKITNKRDIIVRIIVKKLLLQMSATKKVTWPVAVLLVLDVG
jgi:hypothetical protein